MEWKVRAAPYTFDLHRDMSTTLLPNNKVSAADSDKPGSSVEKSLADGGDTDQQETVVLVEQILKEDERSKNGTSKAYVLGFGVPLLALLTLSVVALVQAFAGLDQAKIAASSVSDFIQLDALVSSLQLERGTSVIYISSNGTDQVALYRLWQIQQATDNVLRALANWPPDFIYDGRPLVDKESFRVTLSDIRQLVRNLSVSYSDGIKIYTEATEQLMKAASYEVKIPGRLWTLLVAALATLRASDAMGIQRALGSAFFSMCDVSDRIQIWFVRMDCELVSQQEMAFLYHTDTKVRWQQMLNGDVFLSLTSMKRHIYNPEAYEANCRTMTTINRSDQALVWFNDMTAYMNAWKAVRISLVDEIKRSLNRDYDAEIRKATAYAVLVSVACLLSLLIFARSALYAKHRRRLISRVARFASEMASTSTFLAAEKQKSDNVLNMMFPEHITKQLREDPSFRPQRQHDCVTVYYSDIVGFTSICAISTPEQIVMLLSKMYCNIDAATDRYNVYKLESSQDRCMAVSGLITDDPHHAKEVCLMAIELMKATAEIRIAHLPDDAAKLRIAIHTGSCMAGVIGFNRPYFTIFGKSVSVGIQLLLTGEGCKIQISDSTKAELDHYRGFIVQQRDDLKIEVGDVMTTYWLLDYLEGG